MCCHNSSKIYVHFIFTWFELFSLELTNSKYQKYTKSAASRDIVFRKPGSKSGFGQMKSIDSCIYIRLKCYRIVELDSTGPERQRGSFSFSSNFLWMSTHPSCTPGYQGGQTRHILLDIVHNSSVTAEHSHHQSCLTTTARSSLAGRMS